MAEPRTRPLVETKPIVMFPGVTRRTLVSGDRITLVRIDIEANAVVPEHTHPHEQAGTVVAGRIRLRIGGDARDLDAGTSYLIPGGLPHEVTALAAVTLVEAFSPVREEFAHD